MNDFNAEIGLRVRQRRKDLKYTREKLAYMASISDKFLYDIEVGKKGISAKTLFSLTQALDVSADWLLSKEQKIK